MLVCNLRNKLFGWVEPLLAILNIIYALFKQSRIKLYYHGNIYTPWRACYIYCYSYFHQKHSHNRGGDWIFFQGWGVDVLLVIVNQIFFPVLNGCSLTCIQRMIVVWDSDSWMGQLPNHFTTVRMWHKWTCYSTLVQGIQAVNVMIFWQL